jgi:hypothetical protein
MMRVSAADVLAVCSSTYRTIDLRVAVVRKDDQWVNAFATIRLSYCSPATIRQGQKERQSRYGTIQTAQFAMLSSALPSTMWSALCSQFAQGVFRIGDVDVRLPPVDLATISGYVRPPHSGGFIRDPASWPGAEFAGGENTDGLLNSDQVVRALPGYQSPYQAISAICEADTWPRMNHGYSVLLRLPIFAALAEARLRPVGQTLHASVRLHRRLKGVELHILPTTGIDRIPNSRTTITRLTRETTDGAIETRSGTTPVPSLRPDHLIEMSLWHSAFGELDRRTDWVRDLLPSAARNLLLEVLKHFCSVDQLEEMLTKPNDQSDGKADQSTAFERHVSWLLSLAGFSPIVLGAREHLKGGRGQRATIDIIATSGNTLLLVACTIGAPRHEDFSTLWHLRGLLGGKFADQTPVSIIPVLVTGSTATERYHAVEAGIGIPIIDVGELSEITSSLLDLNPRTLVERLAAPVQYEARPFVPSDNEL